MTYELKEYPDRELMMMDLADLIATELRGTLRHEDRASLAVPGGTTPGPIFDTLSALHLDWDRVDVMLTDERWVPEDSDRSNTRLLKNRLFRDAAQAARLVPLYGGTDTPEESLDALSAGVEAALPLSVVLLGMGADMHTASLFPGADRLEEALSPRAPALLPMRAEGAPEPRITLTARVLNGAMSKHIVITGDAKREALEKAAKTRDSMEAPVKAVLKGAVVHWAQ
ncbi:6-phosphogluconolactonase [Maritimibacter sp. UBA3975]|uniref:6-phosphogluconolactonase n=1 Tax=Maritimibacter sp. UBA3975 TaxID=1946833 RepID=UPI000C093F59|nr:6-phosphogluconolactonase [Maritimibacter sp. UBA3975]MAM60338.1 6-phosphogluconolactonase [Maritimibacter sp.]|tara:strand:- start:5106 stop:5786 length:681 start_codon:yes stop_codon:yes gene_type:complete